MQPLAPEPNFNQVQTSTEMKIKEELNGRNGGNCIMMSFITYKLYKI
jgi:hypothetical protein